MVSKRTALAGKWQEEDRGFETPCHIWQRGKTTAGYPETCADGRVQYAHRVAYELEYGEIPKGVDVHHRCEQRACIRADHLEPLPHDDHAGGRGHGKLNLEKAREIRRRYRRGQPGAPSRHREIDRGNRHALAEEFGITVGTVKAIVGGHRWPEPAISPSAQS